MRGDVVDVADVEALAVLGAEELVAFAAAAAAAAALTV